MFDERKNDMNSTVRTSSYLPLLLAIPVIGLASTPAAAQTLPPNQLCVSTLGSAPTMDGIVGNGAPGDTEDPGWAGATVITPQDPQNNGLGTVRYGTFKLGNRPEGLYVGGVFDQDAVRAADTIVVVISVQPHGAGAPSDWKLVIRPFTASEESASGTGGDATFTGRGLFTNGQRNAWWWKSTTATEPTWNTVDGTQIADASASWLGSTSHFVFGREGPNRWSFEMLIPRLPSTNPSDITTGVNFGTEGTTVRFYANVLTTFAVGDVADPSYQQYPWPTASVITDAGEALERHLPPKAGWGAINLNASGSCGISLTRFGIEHGTAITNEISNGLHSGQSFPASCNSAPNTGTFVTNRFKAQIHSSQPAPVNDLKTTFSVSRFGIDSTWTTLPTVTSSVDPNTDVFPSYDWSLDERSICTLFKAWDHQCLKIDLSSNSGTVLTPSSQINMVWGTASAFNDPAIIDPSKLPIPATGRYRVRLQVFDTVLSNLDDELLGRMGLRPPHCGKGDPLEGSPTCKCEAGPPPDDVHPCSGLNKAAGWKPRPYQSLLRTVKGFLNTGSTITIDKKRYDEAKYIGSYTYLVRHFLDAADVEGTDVGWSGELKDAGGKLEAVHPPKTRKLLVRANERKRASAEPAEYRIDLAPGQSATLGTLITTKEGPKGTLGGGEVVNPGDDGSSGGKVIYNIICCPIQSTTTTALPAPKEIKLGMGLLIAALGLRRLLRRRDDTRSL